MTGEVCNDIDMLLIAVGIGRRLAVATIDIPKEVQTTVLSARTPRVAP